jgi:hypothetical protein
VHHNPLVLTVIALLNKNLSFNDVSLLTANSLHQQSNVCGPRQPTTNQK